ncbi:MAG: type I 3-dehydroquinate dehydratase [Deltaproteobacteria bacterium]|nr:type I 3-dehydroquinate dehydratase [Deltaproteobacteria bacterium]
MKLRGRDLSKDAAVCGVITTSIGSKKLAAVKNLGADLAEIRLDTFDDLDTGKLKAALSKLKKPCLPLLLTVRSKDEGGWREMTAAKRLELFTALTPHVDAVDIELSSKAIAKEVVGKARRAGKKTIISFHDFKKTPPDAALKNVIRRARGLGADAVKIAAFANTRADILRLASLLTANRDLIVIAMGRYGMMTRVFFPLLGSLITYGSLGEPTAPGQMMVKRLKQELAFYNARN